MTARRAPLALVLAVLLLAGCAFTASQKYASAVTVAKNADAQYLQAGVLFDSLINRGQITWTDYQKWSAFSDRYQVTSKRVNATLNRLKGTSDDPSAVLKEATDLAAELATFYAFGQKAAKP